MVAMETKEETFQTWYLYEKRKTILFIILNTEKVAGIFMIMNKVELMSDNNVSYSIWSKQWMMFIYVYKFNIESYSK